MMERGMTAGIEVLLRNAGGEKKVWKDLTQKEVDLNYQKQCSKCRFRGMIGSTHCCDYITIKGKSRGCSALGCKRFERGKRTKVVVGCTVNNAQPLKRREVTRIGRHMKPSSTRLGKALDAYMKENDVNQFTLADRLGVSKTTVSEWRLKTIKLTEGSIERIAGLLGVEKDVIREMVRKDRVEQPGGSP